MKILEHIKSYLEAHKFIEELILFLFILVISFLIYFLFKKVFLVIVKRLVDHSKTKWDDKLWDRKFFSRLLKLFPVLILYISSNRFKFLNEFVWKFSFFFMVLIFLLVVDSFLKAVNDIYDNYKISQEKPIKGYLQTFMIALYFISVVVLVSVLMDVSPFYFLSSIGALTAILVLIFRNTILSLVAGVHLTTQQLIKKGDWITMPQYKADGDVVDIALHNIKIQNFDKTLVSIPTYKFLEESFQNWRGMKEAGGRRIKRSIFIDMTTVRFLTTREIIRFKKIFYLKEYLENKTKELDKYNKENKINLKDKINGRRLTNFGTFRNYVLNYLRLHPKINHDLTLMVRQLESSDKGIPLQIYAFTNEIDWKAYEMIQSDIFDHIISIVPEFGLRLYQQPTGGDFHNIFNKKRK